MPTPANKSLHNWLIAAWPGMGNVAVVAAGYLLQKLGFESVSEIPSHGRFDISNIDVSEGLIEVPRLPRSLFFRHPNPPFGSGLDFTVFLGESQPSSSTFGFAHELLDRAKDMGVDRVVTFASMASQLHPSEQPRVFGAATTKDLLKDLERIDVQKLEGGQIGGLNGVLLGAAAKRGMPGICLLGEIPFFAAGVPNPKAAKAVLETFSQLVDVEFDLEELGRHAERMENVLIQLLERLQKEQSGDGDDDDQPFTIEKAIPEPDPEPTEKKPDFATRQRIEKLFDEAKRDRTKAVGLKRELDKLGLFAQFENRFLDLFKRAD